MGDGVSRLHTAYPGRATRDRPRPPAVTPTGLSPSTARLSRRVRLPAGWGDEASHTPHVRPWGRIRFAPFPVHSPLLGESRLLSFPAGNKMLPFPAFPFPGGNDARGRQEVPFGDPRIDAYLRLRGAYRSLSRPSSAPRARHPGRAVAAVSAEHILGVHGCGGWHGMSGCLVRWRVRETVDGVMLVVAGARRMV